MMIVRCVILILMLSVVSISSLVCYECGCDQSDLSACDCGFTSDFTDNDYCIIYEQRYTDTTYIQLSRTPRNTTWIYIQDSYYILVQESIRYNKTASDWYLWTTGVIFGCDWDLCNAPNLVTALPNSFKLNIDKAWLDPNIYGTGSVTECHHCPTENCGNTTNPIDFNQCPMTTCINSTTCFVYDLWNNIDTGEQCYQSQCAPEYLDEISAEIYGGKYRIDVEAIVYLARDRSNFDIWEIDVYCGANNCSRSTIFGEIEQQLSAAISDLSLFPATRPTTTQAPPTTSTPIANPLQCYSCDCYGTESCPCSTTVVSTLDYTYCIIVREVFGQDVYVYYDYLELDATIMYIRELPFALVEESIAYDEGIGRWFTTTNFVIYGCNWNLCNKPALLPLLPNSFQMRLPEAWLNSSILGSGLPVRDCHECPDEVQCGTTDFLEADKCPIQPCNTTCLVLDTYDDPAYDYLCYQSFCLPPDTEDYEIARNALEIEGVVYASQPNVVEIWEIDIYCRADDCSRPGIFQELHQQLTVQVGTLASLFNETHDPNIPQRRCFDCYCFNDPNCACTRTTIMPANSTYCTIVQENYGQDTWISMEHIDLQSTRVNIREFPYLLVEESIIYSEQTGRWNTLTNLVIYGCNWDYCNHPGLIPSLPTSFQMRLTEAWLNTSVLGSGLPVRNCHECPDAPVCSTTDFIDGNQCPVAQCNTTCIVIDTFGDPSSHLQCYQSFCAPPDSEFYEIDRHRVELEGLLYLNKPTRVVELWEIDIYCRADDCSRPEIFNEIRSQFTTQIGDLSAFEAQLSSTATTPGPGTQPPTTTTTPGPGTQPPITTTTPGPGTQPPATTNSIAPVLATMNVFSMLFITILLINVH